MISEVLFIVHSALLLFFGVFLSAAFSGIKITAKNIGILTLFSAASGIIQLVFLFVFSEELVWKTYPLISHLPLFLLFFFGYKKKASTAIISICTAYLCCQPAKWIGLSVKAFSENSSAEYIARILTLALVFSLIFFKLSDYMAEIFSKEEKAVYIFGITPILYYVFDYISVIYTDFWTSHIHEAAEFLSLSLCIVFLVFCFVYHREYEEKADALRKEQIIRITVEEQKKELDAVKHSDGVIRIMRHDMRHFLANLSASIDNDDKATAKKMISSYVENIDSTVIKNYCGNTTINYILSSFAEKCKEEQIDFVCHAEVLDIACDETMLSTIISNALDNAINAQKRLPKENRKIKIMIKNHNEKLLLSIKNPFAKAPVFINGVPVSNKKGHGFGTQSIVYLTERMGGNCRFEVENNEFVLMVVI